VYYNPHKNSKVVKKGAALCKIVSMKKVVKYRWKPRNGCDSRSMTKYNNENSGYLISASLGIGTKFTWIIVVKIFVTDLPSQPFLGHHLHFTAFSMVAICIGLQLFYSLAVFEWISHLFVSYITWFVLLFCRKKKACKKMWRYYMHCIQIL